MPQAMKETANLFCEHTEKNNFSYGYKMTLNRAGIVFSLATDIQEINLSSKH